jgi:hypothetical protein
MVMYHCFPRAHALITVLDAGQSFLNSHVVMPQPRTSGIDPSRYNSIVALHRAGGTCICFCEQCDGAERTRADWVTKSAEACRHVLQGRQPGDELKKLAAVEGSLAARALHEWVTLLSELPPLANCTPEFDDPAARDPDDAGSVGLDHGGSPSDICSDSEPDDIDGATRAERTDLAMVSVGAAQLRETVRFGCERMSRPGWPRDCDVELRFKDVLTQWISALELAADHSSDAAHLVSMGHSALGALAESHILELVSARVLTSEFKGGSLYTVFCSPQQWLPADKSSRQRPVSQSAGAGAASAAGGHSQQTSTQSAPHSCLQLPRVSGPQPVAGAAGRNLNSKATPATRPSDIRVTELPPSLYASRRRSALPGATAASLATATFAAHTPAFENATCESTLAEVQAAALEIYHFQGGRRARNELIHLLLRDVLLPSGPARERFPPSVYLLEQQGTAVPSRDREYHTCANCCSIFFPPAQSQAEYLENWDQKCEVCGLPRFKKLPPLDILHNELPLFSPSKLVHVCSVIEDMQDKIDASDVFENDLHWITTAYRRSVKGLRSDPNDLNSRVRGIWHGSVIQDGMAPGGFMESENVLPCRLFTDGVQVLGSGAPEVWPVGIVPLSPDPAWRAKREHRFLVSVSTDKPKSFNALLHLLVIDHAQRPLILRRHNNRQLWLGICQDAVDGPAGEGIHNLAGHKCCKPCGNCDVKAARFEDHKAMALRGYLVGMDGENDRHGGAQTRCARRSAESLLADAAEADRMVGEMRRAPARGQAAGLARHVTRTGVKGFSAMVNLLGYNALTTPTCDFFHGEILDTLAPFWRFLFLTPDDRKAASPSRRQWSLTADQVKLASAMLQPGWIKWPSGRGRPLADGARRGGNRRLCGEDWEKFSAFSIYLFDDLIADLDGIGEQMLWAVTCLRTSLTLQLIPGLRWRGQALSEKHDLAYIRTLERLKIPPADFNPFTGIMHEKVAHAREFTMRFGQQVESWGKTTEQAMQDVKKFVPRGSTGSGGLSALIVSSYSKWLAGCCAADSTRSADADGNPLPVVRTLKDFAEAAKARVRPPRAGRTARKRRGVARDAPDSNTPGGDCFLMGGTPVVLPKDTLMDVMRLLQRHPERASGYDHTSSIDANADALSAPELGSVVEFRGARVNGTSYNSERRRTRGRSAGPTGGYTIAMLRRGPDGIVEANCEVAERRQCLDTSSDFSPPSRICIDVGDVKRFLLVTFGNVTARLMQVQWYAPAAYRERVREEGAEGAGSSKGKGKRPAAARSNSEYEMYRRAQVLPPYLPLGGDEGDGSALLARNPQPQPQPGDGSFSVLVSAQHGRLPIVDKTSPCSQNRSWCFVDAIYDHALLVAYPSGTLGGSYFGQTDLGALAKKLHGSHAPSWRIVLPCSPEMVLRMGLLGKHTSSVLYDKVVGIADLYAGSSWRSRCGVLAARSLGLSGIDTEELDEEEGEEGEEGEQG